MATSVPSHATPRMLEWARKSARLTIEQVAKLENVAPEVIGAWESGDEIPSFTKLEHLAKRYKRPIMVFYLPEPPGDFNVVRDFRFLPEDRDAEFSPKLAYFIRLSQERQAWASAYLQDTEGESLEFVGSVTTANNVTDVADNLRTLLGVTLEEQVASTSSSRAYALWRQRCEDAGCFVFQAPRIDIREMRGFALSDAYAPVVVVNAQDQATARAFTLVHEFVHILLGQSAVSGGDQPVVSRDPVHRIERFCNRVAAETLVPTPDFRTQVPRNWRTRDDEILTRSAKRYHVSRAVIAVKLVETGFADQEYLSRKLPALKATKPKKQSRVRLPPERVVLSRTGNAFARLTISAYNSGSVQGNAVTALLKTKLKYLPQIESQLNLDRHKWV